MNIEYSPSPYCDGKAVLAIAGFAYSIFKRGMKFVFHQHDVFEFSFLAFDPNAQMIVFLAPWAEDSVLDSAIRTSNYTMFNSNTHLFNLPKQGHG